jgi:hypothetical protein
MALLFMDGFDKYGGVNTNATSVAALMAGEWTTITSANIAAPLSATGQAMSLGTSGVITKTLGTSYSRLLGGIRFNAALSTANVGITFQDAGNGQAGIRIPTTGIISVVNGLYNTGTILGSASSAISANTTHYLEWDISFSNSAAFTVYLDGVSIISGTGDTTTTTNNSANGVLFGSGSGGSWAVDDLYLFDTSGTTNNAVLLTSPRIETQVPVSDSAVQFAIGSSVLGATVSRTTTNLSTAANFLCLRPFTPARNCTLNSISLVPLQTNASANLRPVVYADNAGSPTGGALLSAGSTVTGQTGGTTLTMPLTTPQSLTAGTQYWLGWMVDVTSTNVVGADGNTSGRNATVTFTSGAPGTCPVMGTGVVTPLLWGNITLTTPVNFYEVNQQPPAGINSYVYDAIVAHEDLYNFPNLSTPGAIIHSVAVKGLAQKSDSGARTVSFRIKSGATDSGGSLTGQAPGTSFAWMGSFFPTDPNTSAAWTVANLNLATGGMRIDS